MRTFLLVLMSGFTAVSLPAQAVRTPAFRLTPEAVNAAARRIDEAALQSERLMWAERMKSPGSAPTGPFIIPPLVDDEAFLRRASLDIQARLPLPQEIRAFLADPDPARRSRLVDRLLADPSASARRFVRLADMLRVKDEVLGLSLTPYVNWLRDACASALPYDQLARRLLTANGNLATDPATGYLLSDEGHLTVSMTEALRVFLDEDISCARCHDHAFTHWTQMQFYQFAACFNGTQVTRTSNNNPLLLWPPERWNETNRQQLQAGESLSLVDARNTDALRLPPRYYYRDGKSGDPVKPALPEWKGLEVGKGAMQSLARVSPENYRSVFADWLLNNQRFALVAAMRTWHEFLGSPGAYVSMEGYETETSRRERIRMDSCEYAPVRGVPSMHSGPGLVAQLVEYRKGPTYRAFADAMIREMTAVKYDLREFERIICHTQVYQRESLLPSVAQPLQVLAPVVRPLPPETVWNNLMRVQTDANPRTDAPLSHELPQVPAADHPARLLGRGAREWGDDSHNTITHTLVRVLMNGAPSTKATATDSPLVRRLRIMQPPNAAVEEAFLSVLGRTPSYAETMKAMDAVIDDPANGWSDIVWALINSSEFVFQR